MKTTLQTKNIFHSVRPLPVCKILKIIMNNFYCTPTSIIKMTDIPQATVYRTLNALLQSKIIYKSGIKVGDDGKHSSIYSTTYNIFRLEVTKKGVSFYVLS